MKRGGSPLFCAVVRGAENKKPPTYAGGFSGWVSSRYDVLICARVILCAYTSPVR